MKAVRTAPGGGFSLGPDGRVSTLMSPSLES